MKTEKRRYDFNHRTEVTVSNYGASVERESDAQIEAPVTA
jgi:hypothetical protein